jgi:hypothetical protein
MLNTQKSIHEVLFRSWQPRWRHTLLANAFGQHGLVILDADNQDLKRISFHIKEDTITNEHRC